MSETGHPPSAWRPLIEDWTARETRLRPHQPVLLDSVRVRDAVEVGDQAYVLLSFDVDHPWPQEEDLGTARGGHTAVIQAERSRQPWIERDSTRALSIWRTTDGAVSLHEHLFGSRRALSGQAPDGASSVAIGFEDDTSVEATVVDGWFLAVVPEDRRVRTASVDGAGPVELERTDTGAMLPDPSFARSAGDAMYFSPLDLRTILPVVQWQRAGGIVVVATCIEQYDDGGMLRVRIDGIRADDDTFVTWPRIELEADGRELPSAVCGEYSLADTISLDIGFRPWFASDVERLTIRVTGARGPAGEVEPIVLDVQLPPR